MAIHEWVTLVGAILAMLMSLAGWAYQIGVQNTRTERAEQDIKYLQDSINRHHERVDLHVNEEWRAEIRGALVRLEMKIDRLPCKHYSACDVIEETEQGRI